ncbi:MAG: type II CAAX endopeptidase family protein [Actinomycetaceae bacterium]|nr:type II CAAX endopeptidase family protein [Actinomycetaceae bacterium]
MSGKRTPEDEGQPAENGVPHVAQEGTPATPPPIPDTVVQPALKLEVSDSHSRPSDRFGLALGVYIAVAFGLAWLIALPLWFAEGLNTPGFPLYALAMMATPTIAAIVVVLFVEKPPSTMRALGLTPLTPVKRLIGYCLLAFVVIVALCSMALPVGALLGQYEADFTGFSGFEQIIRGQLASAGIPELPLSIETMVMFQLLNIVIASFTINVIPALGEEIGWRGWLLPRLLNHFGAWSAIGISGVMWGIWHAPVILLGYNYPDTPGWLALIAMTIMCTIIGGIIGWLRLRGGSVWPAAIAHSTLNAAAGIYVLFMAEDTSVNTLHASVLGWTGWIIPAIVLILIVTTGRFHAVCETPSLADKRWRNVEVPRYSLDNEAEREYP